MVIVRIGPHSDHGALFGVTHPKIGPLNQKGPQNGVQKHPTRKGQRASCPMRTITVAAQVLIVGELPSY